MSSQISRGPLAGVRVLEFAGIGPGPFAGMFLSDLGADITTVRRPGSWEPSPTAFDARGRRTIMLDLKKSEAVEACLALAERADMVFEGNRPGVMERLGLGPEVMLQRNPGLVYGRMTGWGQDGPLATVAGHDINYLSLSGALHAIGPAERPVPPLNLVADYGGGAMFLLTGMLAALIHARQTGQGQVVDAAMVDGCSYLLSTFHGALTEGHWQDKREANTLDGAAPFYGTYQCSDGQWVSIGSIEPQFYALLLEKTGIEPTQAQLDTESWPMLRDMFAQAIARKSRSEWCAIMEGTDVCFAPVLTLAEAPRHPHNVARGVFCESGGVAQPSPAPRFSHTPAAIQLPPVEAVDLESALMAWDALVQ